MMYIRSDMLVVIRLFLFRRFNTVEIVRPIEMSSLL